MRHAGRYAKNILIAGPCAIESKEQAYEIAGFVKKYGATIFRAGAYKGQNRPVVDGKPEYLGMGDKGVEILAGLQIDLDIDVACDMQSVRQARVLKANGIAYPQVGARNMDSLELLRQFRKIFNNSNFTIQSRYKTWITSTTNIHPTY